MTRSVVMVANPTSRSWDMVNWRYVLISFSLEKLPLPAATVIRIVRKILKALKDLENCSDSVHIEDNPNRCSPSGHWSSTPPPRQQEATYARVARARSSSNLFTLVFSPTDYESKSSRIHIHPHNFLLHDQISFAENHRDSGA
ncbi:hypothetical protein AVEN_88260-1 [Araneus ventricosus]|uniref:Uncharacterized protein n=1 Tax=Araneus ventricosus TaxID=182803 RepID=A0A4Y2EL86_ARAVE|nr:hypothetical protein AVEN_88260-1 [Araneus ventricosus]